MAVLLMILQTVHSEHGNDAEAGFNLMAYAISSLMALLRIHNHDELLHVRLTELPPGYMAAVMQLWLDKSALARQIFG